TDPHYARVKDGEAKRVANVARLQARYDAAIAVWKPARGLTQNLERWIEGQRGAQLVDFVGPEPVLRKNETPAQAVERCRRRGRQLEADIQKIQAAPHPSALRKEAARAQIAAWAERARLGALSSVDHGEDLTPPTAAVEILAFGLPRGALVTATTFDALGLIARMFGDRLYEVACEEIDAVADDAAALDPRARKEALETA